MSPPPTFTSSTEWVQYAQENGIPLPSSKTPVPIDEIAPIHLDYTSSRARQALEHAHWRAAHPLSSLGYVSSTLSIPSSSGHPLEVKVSWPDAERLARNGKTQGRLPVLFTCFGGGWIQGGHTSEEMWMLWPVYPVFEVVVVSVGYRLGPENPAPIWVEDYRVILAGSSTGGGIAAALSQRCRDADMPIYGVMLNVPVLCDYRHFERAEKEIGVGLRSYEYATEALLPSGAMKWIWSTLYPDASSSLSPDTSPLLGNVRGLPKHVVFVAGQDALCDEGLAYVEKLREAGVEVEAELYEGVPHVFGEFWGLEVTNRWGRYLRMVLGGWLDI